MSIVMEIIDYKFSIHYMETFNWLLKIYTGIDPNRLLTSI